MKPFFLRSRRQAGMALIVSLVILLSMTLLGLAALQNTNMEERMAGNLRSENMALQAAEAALRVAEAWFVKLPGAPPPAGAGGNIPGKLDVWQEEGPDQLQGLDGIGSPWPAKYGDRWWFKWSDLEFGDEDDYRYWTLYGVPVGSEIDLQYVAPVGDDPATARSLVDPDAPRIWPRYVIEDVGLARDHLVIGQQRDVHPIQYRITARGVDAGGRSEVLLASKVKHRF